MTKKIDYLSRKHAVHNILWYDFEPDSVAKSIGVSSQTMARYIEEFVTIPEQSYELYWGSSLGPKGVDKLGLVDIIWKGDGISLGKHVCNVAWSKVHAYRKCLSRDEKLKLQRGAYMKENKSIDKETTELFLMRGFCFIDDFRFVNINAGENIDVVDTGGKIKCGVNESRADLSTVHMVRRSVDGLKWVNALTYPKSKIEASNIYDAILRNGDMVQRLSSASVISAISSRKGHKDTDIVRIRPSANEHQIDKDMAYMMADGIPNTLMFHKLETPLDITLKDGSRINGINLGEVDWNQLRDNRDRVIAWTLSRGIDKAPNKEVDEYVEAPSGFDNISIASGCVVAYRTDDVPHPVLVLKDKRPLEYIKICNLMALGDEEGIKDVLRSIFDK